jgi:hypothetical protein
LTPDITKQPITAEASVTRLSSMIAVIGFLFSSIQSMGTDRGLVDSAEAYNTALLVGVSHGLPGIDFDVRNVDRMATDPAYKFITYTLMDEKGTLRTVQKELEDKASRAGENGTFYFYFSGHGAKNNIYLQDGLLKVTEMRAAIERGRAAAGPLARLVLMFDSCYSGSLLGPFRRFLEGIGHGMGLDITSHYDLAQSVVQEFTRGNRLSAYWSKLFVFASSRADETSNASSQGSEFTLALRKAFDEVMEKNGTMREWIAKTQKYTTGHHPVARLVPESLYNEKMVP